MDGCEKSIKPQRKKPEELGRIKQRLSVLIYFNLNKKKKKKKSILTGPAVQNTVHLRPKIRIVGLKAPTSE